MPEERPTPKPHQGTVLHPRPQLRRSSCEFLNGLWDFHFDKKAEYATPDKIQWDHRIIVPFSPETTASGIADTGFYVAVWYRRTFQAPKLRDDDCLLLHFEAVDYSTTVWINGSKVCEHEGGYTPFTIEITQVLKTGAPQEIVVRAEDDPADLAKPRGKQDWCLEPHSIWYPRTTGIWQPVWLEIVPRRRIETIYWASSLERWAISLDVAVLCAADEKLLLRVCLTCGEQLLADDSYMVIAGEVHRHLALSDPGIDDFRNNLLWSPSSPNLIEATLELLDEDGNVIDSLRSYTALRSVAAQGDRFILNGRPLALRLVLDQGYWLESGLTAPSDEALVNDILLVKKLGFNGVRKHQKIESARYLYWADRLGLLVWEEMPSSYRYTTKSIERFVRQWPEVIRRDRSHPCIVAWVPFNESWGVPDLPDSSAQRHFVQALYHLTKSLDPTRLVVGNDGWESIATDIIGIHDYDDQPDRLGQRYGVDDIEPQLFKRGRPGGRMLLVGGDKTWKHPIVLTEFGGIAFSLQPENTWGYSKTHTAEELLQKYNSLLSIVRSLPALAGFCYTQFTDTYQEANGLLYADRTPKVPFSDIALATSGTTPDQGFNDETVWRDRLRHSD